MQLISFSVSSVPSLPTSGPLRISSVSSVQTSGSLRVFSVPLSVSSGFFIVSGFFFSLQQCINSKRKSRHAKEYVSFRRRLLNQICILFQQIKKKRRVLKNKIFFFYIIFKQHLNRPCMHTVNKIYLHLQTCILN